MGEPPDREPGDEVSLRALYAAVPGAEALDLTERADDEDAAAQPGLDGVDVPVSDDDDWAADPDLAADRPDEADSPWTDGQARGVLEHLLGAEPVEDDPDDET